MAGAASMARPKKKKAAKPPDERMGIIHLKGSPEYSEWLDGFYEHTHISKAVLVRLGLKMLAEHYDYTSPPEL